MQQNFSQIPNELKAKKQWVLWRLEEREPGKTTKLPYQPSGYMADVANPSTWNSFETVIAAYGRGGFSGIGFMFNNDYVAIDFDHVAIDGIIEPEFQIWVERFNSYTEFSQSGNGLHIIVKGTIPGEKRRKGNIEMYSEKRYFALTGNILGNHIDIKDAQKEIDELYMTYLEQPEISSLSVCSNVLGNPGNWEEIKALLERSKNAGKFFQLWSGNISAYKSQSEAELALCSMIAFYTQDIGQIESIVAMSGLNRDKWSVEDYRKRTIAQAIQGLLGRYEWRKKIMTTNIISLDEKLSKRLVKKEIEIVFIGVLAMREKAYQISLNAKQIGLDGVVSVWVPKSAILNYDEEKSSFLLPEWLVKSFPKDAKKI